MELTRKQYEKIKDVLPVQRDNVRIGKSRGGRNKKIHMIVANERMPIVFQLSPGSCHDDPEGRKLILQLPKYYREQGLPLLMDKAYEGDEVRSLAVKQGLKPVVSPKCNRKKPREYDVESYKRRNEVERFFTVFSPFEGFPPCFHPLRQTRCHVRCLRQPRHHLRIFKTIV